MGGGAWLAHWRAESEGWDWHWREGETNLAEAAALEALDCDDLVNESWMGMVGGDVPSAFLR